MAQYDELVEALIWLLTNRVQNKINYSHGLLGDGQGRVRVAGNEDFVYARPDRFSSRTQQVFNKRVEGQDGDPIIIGELPWEPGLQQVISIDWQTYKEVGWGGDTSGFVYHGRTHIWKDAAPGLDTFPVYRRQLGDLQATASISGTNAVDISSYSMELYGTQKQFPGTIGYPLTNAIPTSTGTARMALLYWDPSSGTTGYIGVATGTAGIDSESTILNRPVSLPGTVPIAFVRLAAGQAGITEFDIFDAREPFRPGIGFGTGPGQFNASLIPIADPDGHYTGTSVESALDEIGDGSLPLDTFKVAKLWELDGGAVAYQTDNSGNLSGKGTISIPGSFIITGTGQAFRGSDGAEPSIGISDVSGRVGSIYQVGGEVIHTLGTMQLEATSAMLQISGGNWNVYATGTANIYADLYIDHNQVPVIVNSFTRTVKSSGGDFTTIQGAVDWFKNKLIVGSCIIDVEAGTYDEAVVFDDIFCGNQGSLTLRGDTRELAGMSYVDGAVCNRIGKTNGGTGTVSLSNSGTTLTVTMSTTNPDFDADGWGSGDKIIAYDNSGTTTEFTISSVSNNVFTLTATAPTIGNDATAIVLKPNRLIDRSTAGPCIQVNQARGVAVDGFYLESATGANCNGVYALYGASVFVQNCLAIVEDFGFYASGWFSSVDCSSGDSSAWGCNRGFYSDPSAQVLAQRTVANNCTQAYIAQNLSSLSAQFTVAVNSTTGYLANSNANMSCTTATARQCTTGYSSATGPSFVNATTTNANNNGNGTNYSPAPTVPGYAQGTDYAVLFAS